MCPIHVFRCSGATATYKGFDIILTHISSLASTTTVTAVPHRRVVYPTLLDASY